MGFFYGCTSSRASAGEGWAASLPQGTEDKSDLHQVACSCGKKFRFLCVCGGTLSGASCPFSGTMCGGAGVHLGIVTR